MVFLKAGIFASLISIQNPHTNFDSRKHSHSRTQHDGAGPTRPRSLTQRGHFFWPIVSRCWALLRAGCCMLDATTRDLQGFNFCCFAVTFVYSCVLYVWSYVIVVKSVSTTATTLTTVSTQRTITSTFGI